MTKLHRPQDGAISVTEYELFWLIAGILLMLFFHKPSKPAPKREAKAANTNNSMLTLMQKAIEDGEELDNDYERAARLTKKNA